MKDKLDRENLSNYQRMSRKNASTQSLPGLVHRQLRVQY